MSYGRINDELRKIPVYDFQSPEHDEIIKKLVINKMKSVHIGSGKLNRIAILGGSFDPPTISHLQVYSYFA